MRSVKDVFVVRESEEDDERDKRTSAEKDRGDRWKPPEDKRPEAQKSSSTSTVRAANPFDPLDSPDRLKVPKTAPQSLGVKMKKQTEIPLDKIRKIPSATKPGAIGSKKKDVDPEDVGMTAANPEIPVNLTGIDPNTGKPIELKGGKKASAWRITKPDEKEKGGYSPGKLPGEHDPSTQSPLSRIFSLPGLGPQMSRADREKFKSPSAAKGTLAHKTPQPMEPGMVPDPSGTKDPLTGKLKMIPGNVPRKGKFFGQSISYEQPEWKKTAHGTVDDPNKRPRFSPDDPNASDRKTDSSGDPRRFTHSKDARKPKEKPGEKNYGKVLGKSRKTALVWDGNEWLDAHTFGLKFPGQAKKADEE